MLGRSGGIEEDTEEKDTKEEDTAEKDTKEEDTAEKDTKKRIQQKRTQQCNIYCAVNGVKLEASYFTHLAKF